MASVARLVAAALAVLLLTSTHLVTAKCLGTSCKEMEAYASEHGLLGTSSPTCRGRDRTFAYKPEWLTPLDSELYSLTWSGSDDEWVWAITTGANNVDSVHYHHLYWSKDHGTTLTDRYQDLLGAIKALKGDSFNEDMDAPHASVNQIIVHASDQRRVIVWGDGFYSFATSDGGETFIAQPTPNGTYGLSHEIRPHPTQPDWLLSLSYRNACYQAGGVGCAMDLYLTTDFGATWTNLTAASGGKIAGFLDFDWGYHNSDAKYRELFQEATIVASGHTKAYMSLQQIPADDVHLWRSDDHFRTVRRLASCGAAFELVAGQVFFARPDACPIDVNGKPITPKSKMTDAITLYVSSDGERFGEVCMPTELSDAGYTMVSTQDGRGAFIVADHKNRDAAVSNMYANGNIAELYTMSLRNVHYGFRRGSYPDVTALRPIRGRFMANQLLSLTPGNPYVSDRDFHSVAVTKVTHNAGASWDYVTVDPKNVKSPVCKSACEGGNNCYLHLHGSSSWVRGNFGRPSIYASESAPGLVMASGNLGPEKDGLKMDKDALCTWLSRDGGLTWTDVIDDMYIYEYLNHGNAIVMAKFREEGPATQLHVSMDQGQCFYSINITPDDHVDTELFVNNLRVEPDGAATFVHIIGTQHIKSLNTRKDVIITIDIASVLRGEDDQKRTLPPRSQCGVGDFEDWAVSNESGAPLCVLGQQHTYHRIKPTSATDPCFLQKNYQRPKSVSQRCDCALEDFYCEYGYEKVTNSDCQPLTVGYAPKCKAIELDAYKPSTSHLRLPHGSMCPNVNTFIHDTDGNGNMDKTSWIDGSSSSGKNKKDNKSGAGFWGWLAAILLLGGGAVAFVMFAPAELKDKLSMVTEPVIGGVIWVMDSVKKLVNRARGHNPEELGFERLGDSQQESLYAVP